MRWAKTERRNEKPDAEQKARRGGIWERKRKKAAAASKKQPLLLVRLGGFEPLAFRVGAERSIQLSYKRTTI